MMWSQVQHTPLARVVSDYIEQNTKRYKLTYHNLDHVASMYAYLEYSKETYDEALDWAVLFHDAVYDDKPDKERRSAELFTEYSESVAGCVLGTEGRDRVVQLIMATVDHVETKPYTSAIIRADLSGLEDPVSTSHNYNKILSESKNLYNIVEHAFAEANIQYMRKLRNTVKLNQSKSSSNAKFYLAVLRGINQTINTSKMLQGYNGGEI